jgi:hypothetical protein
MGLVIFPVGRGPLLLGRALRASTARALHAGAVRTTAGSAALTLAVAAAGALVHAWAARAGAGLVHQVDELSQVRAVDFEARRLALGQVVDLELQVGLGLDALAVDTLALLTATAVTIAAAALGLQVRARANRHDAGAESQDCGQNEGDHTLRATLLRFALFGHWRPLSVLY